MSQKAGDVTTYFSYDSAGNLIGMSAGSNRYFYTRNAQNDITGLIDEKGVSVVQYQYDSWGKLLGITGSLASTIGKRNPFRYRGYYYDDETGMYYLQSRYYDPEIKRFICADDINMLEASMETVHNRNLYVYCDNNPIVRVDGTGQGWIAGAFIGAVTSVCSQWIVEKKIDWLEVGCSAISGAVDTFSLKPLVRICINTAVNFAMEISNGKKSVGDAFIDAVISGSTDELKTDIKFKDNMKKYRGHIKEINLTDNSTGWKSQNTQRELRHGLRQTGREAKVYAITNSTVDYVQDKSNRHSFFPKSYYIACQRDAMEYAKRHRL